MKKEIIYRTQIGVNGVLAQESFGARKVTLKGVIARCTERKLLGIIPLPDCYKWEVQTVETVKTKAGDTDRTLREDRLTFESRKRLAEERQNLEAWLRNKCKDYRKKYGTGR